MSNNKKPRIDIRSIRWLETIDERIRSSDLRGPYSLGQVAADTLDGYATRSELDDLIRRRLLTVIRYADTDEGWGVPSDTCGGSWSVDLTPRALQAFWPDRMAAPARRPVRRPRSADA